MKPTEFLVPYTIRARMPRQPAGLLATPAFAMALLAFLWAPSLRAQVAFAPAIAGPAAVPEATGLAFADLTGDHRDELLAIHGPSATLSAMRLDGQGAFQIVQTVATGVDPVAVAAVDLDGDGLTDVVVSNRGDGTVSLYRNGGGTLLPPVVLYAGAGPRAPAAGDLNGSGLPDLVVPLDAAGAGAQFSVILNLGGFQFAPAAAVPLPAGAAGPRQAALGDFDGDGNLDAAFACYATSNVALLGGDGAGGFAPAGVFGTGTMFTTGLVVADMDGDGLPDVVASSFLPPSVSYLRGSGALGFLPAVSINGGVHVVSIAAADFDVDGSPDIAVCDVATNTLRVLRNDGAGGLAPVFATFAPAAPEAVAAGDPSGSFLPGIAAAYGGLPGIEVFLNAHPEPVLGMCGRGTVQQAPGQFVDTLHINGSSGGAARRVDAPAGAPVSLSVSAPPLAAPGRPFALWVMAGTASASTVTRVPLAGAGNSCLRPFHLFPSDSSLLVLSNSFFADPFALLPMAPAPATELVPLPPGPFTATVQGLIETGPGIFRLTNGIILRTQ